MDGLHLCRQSGIVRHLEDGEACTAEPLMPALQKETPETIHFYINGIATDSRRNIETAEQLASLIGTPVRMLYNETAVRISAPGRPSLLRKIGEVALKVTGMTLDLLKAGGGKLHFIIYFRSWDLWAGFPTNLGGLQLLKEYMAKEIGVEDGEMICVSKGLHLYEHAWEFATIAGRLT